MFIGRKKELDSLNDSFTSERSELVVIYGRRRIGKSALVEKFLEDKNNFLSFEALEGEQTTRQIEHFVQNLAIQTNDVSLGFTRFENWERLFFFFTEKVINQRETSEKLVIFFDEIQWMAAGRSALISLLKYFWDNHWKKQNVVLILCGSVASFMVKKVIQSKALYGRITKELLVQGLNPEDAVQIFKSKRSLHEVIKYILVFGGVPKYLEEIKLNKSFSQNMNILCFEKNSLLLREIERIFYSQFKESRIYRQIVDALQEKQLTFKQISDTLNIASGGGLKQYLDNLENAEMIRHYVPFNQGSRSKTKKYGLTDEFLIFYFRYMKPNIESINNTVSSNLFDLITKNSFNVWLGFAFERFCIKHASLVARKMGFGRNVLTAGPYFSKTDEQFQIDLLFKRSDDVITLCEVKYLNSKVTTTVIKDVERKCSLFNLPRGYTLEKALISLNGPDEHLFKSGYFHHYLKLEDFFN